MIEKKGAMRAIVPLIFGRAPQGRLCGREPKSYYFRVPARQKRSAVFLDRDGVIIEDVHYLSSPGQVRLIAGGLHPLFEQDRLMREDQAIMPVVDRDQRGGEAPGGLVPLHRKGARGGLGCDPLDAGVEFGLLGGAQQRRIEKSVFGS